MTPGFGPGGRGFESLRAQSEITIFLFFVEFLPHEMEYYEEIKRELTEKISRLVGREVTIKEIKRKEFGDFFTNIAFLIAKEQKRKAEEVADEIKRRIEREKPSIVAKVESVGGYINFFLNKEKISGSILKKILKKKEKYGSQAKKNKKIVIEHTSANPIKPIHIGTLRCSLVGDTLARVLRKLGYKVEVQNYINDLGRQVAVLLFGFERLKIKREKNWKYDFWLGLIYTKASSLLEKKPEFEEEVRKIISELENLRGKYHKLKEKLVINCVKSMLETAWNFNVYYDALIFERDLVRSGVLERTLRMIEKCDKVYEIKEGEDKGCLAIDMSDCKDLIGETLKDYKIIRRSDGTITYEGKDIAYHLWKFGVVKGLKFSRFLKQPNGEFLYTTNSRGKVNGFGHADKVINVIGFEQKFSQLVVFNAARILGFERIFKNSIHLPFEWVWVGKGDKLEKISGRSGTWIECSADKVYEMVLDFAKRELKKRNVKLKKKELEEIARKIAVASIRFYLLKFDLDKKIVFDPSKVVDFEGESGAYVQYATLRAKRILDKVKRFPKSFDPSLLKEKEETELIWKLGEFPKILEEISKSLKVNLLATYTFELAKKFNEFYNKCRVIGVGGRLEESRVCLVFSTYQVLKNCCDLLGIEIPKLM